MDKIKKQRADSMKGHKSFLQLINDEKLLNFPTYDRRVKREKFYATRAKTMAKEKKARKEAAAAAQKQESSSE